MCLRMYVDVTISIKLILYMYILTTSFSLVRLLPHVELIKRFYFDLGHLLILTKGHLSQLVDTGTMHSLGMEN